MTPDELNVLLDSLVRHANYMRGLDPRLEQEVADLLQHPDPSVVNTAAAVLGAIGSDAQLPRLLALTGHPLDSHRAAAASALAGYACFDDRKETARRALLPLLDDPATAVRLIALQSLGSLGIDGAEERVVAFLSHHLPPFRRLAAELTGRHHLKGAIPALERLLADDLEEIRVAACASLILLGVTDVLENAQRLLRAQAPMTRIAILRAIQFGRATWAADELIACLRDTNQTVRDHALQGVRVLKVRAALPLLRALLRNHPELFPPQDLERAIAVIE